VVSLMPHLSPTEVSVTPLKPVVTLFGIVRETHHDLNLVFSFQFLNVFSSLHSLVTSLDPRRNQRSHFDDPLLVRFLDWRCS
jgi:hypothetical protein